MATNERNYRGLATSSSEYARSLPGNGSGFRGVDFSSNAAFVSPARLVWCENMYRDYHSEQGGAIETIPGYRLYHAFDETIYGMWRYMDREGREYLAVHAGNVLYLLGQGDGDGERITCKGAIESTRSLGFQYNGEFYLIDGQGYYVLEKSESGFSLVPVKDTAFVPTTHVLGKEYMQRNMLTPYFKQQESIVSSEELPLVTTEDFLESVDFLGNKFFRFARAADTVRVGEISSTDKDYREFDLATWDTMRTVCFEGNGIRIYNRDNPENETLERIVIRDISRTDTDDSSEETLLGAVGFAEPLSSCTALKELYFCTEGGTLYLPEAGIFPRHAMKLFFSFAEGNLGNYIENGSPKHLPPNVCFNYGDNDTVKIYNREFAPVKFFLDETDICQGFTQEEWEDSNSMLFLIAPFVIYPKEGKLAVELFKDNLHSTGSYYLKIPFLNKDGGREVIELVIEVSENPPEESTYVFGVDVKPVTVTPYSEAKRLVGATSGALTLPTGTWCNEHVVLMPTDESLAEVTFEGVGQGFGTVGNHASYEAANTAFRGTAIEAITGCTIAEQFDDRIFLAGNPKLPNTVFYCGRNDSSVTDPTYFGVLNYFNDGTGYDCITGMLAAGSHLMVMKSDTVYYHQGADGDDIVPRVYPATQGAVGIGCVAPCSTCNFRDDPVFLSKFGIEGVSKEQLTLERTLGHRSSLVDQKLLSENALSCAACVEWDGWYCLFVNGNVYMADSRALYQDSTGNAQYEWFYLTGIGDRADDVPVYRSVSGEVCVADTLLTQGNFSIGNDVEKTPLVIADEDIFFCDNDGDDDAGEVRRGYIYDADGEKLGNETHLFGVRDGVAYLLEETEERRGGTFCAAEHPTTVGECLFFAANGKVFVFNTDKRGEGVTLTYDDGTKETEPVAHDRIHRKWYTFAGHRIEAKASTALDDCDVPHLAKNTVKRSLVLRAKVMAASAFSLLAMTDRTAAWQLVETRSNANDGFYDDDFTNKSLQVASDAIYVGREKEKRWVEKQFLLCDTGFMRPFGFYELTYRYTIAGRIKG